MKRIDVGQILQVLANLGVVAGLIFLTLQLRQNNELIQLQAYATFLANRLAVNEYLLGNPELGAAFFRAHSGEPVSPYEQFLIERFYQSIFTAWESEYRQYRRGLLSGDDLPVAGWRAAFRTWPSIREYWENTKETRDQDFRLFVDATLRESE